MEKMFNSILSSGIYYYDADAIKRYKKSSEKEKKVDRYVVLNKRIACDVRNTTLIIFITAHPNVAFVTP
jgi:hypothetical protein